MFWTVALQLTILSTAVVTAEPLPFPQWLKDITGLSAWPGLENPPYIPLSHIDLSKVPDYQPYSTENCYINPRESCSFDCHHCVEQDDVFTCARLSQTFDDGPSTSTPRLLENLRQRTTFFLLGYNTVQLPDIFRQVKDKGHLVGTHTWSHLALPTLTNEQIVAQIEWSIWAMNATTGQIPRWFRPPYGAIDNRVRAITRQFNLRAVLWDHDSNDWQLNSNPEKEPEILEAVKSWIDGPKTGGIILEHDSTDKTVSLGLKINEIIGEDQWTVAQCANDKEYL